MTDQRIGRPGMEDAVIYEQLPEVKKYDRVNQDPIHYIDMSLAYAESKLRYTELFQLKEEFAQAITGSMVEGPDYQKANEVTDAILIVLSEIAHFICYPNKLRVSKKEREKDWRFTFTNFRIKSKQYRNSLHRAIYAFTKTDIQGFLKHVDKAHQTAEECIRWMEQKVIQEKAFLKNTQHDRIEGWTNWLKNKKGTTKTEEETPQEIPLPKKQKMTPQQAEEQSKSKSQVMEDMIVIGG